jgi:hypothetical protein
MMLKKFINGSFLVVDFHPNPLPKFFYRVFQPICSPSSLIEATPRLQSLPGPATVDTTSSAIPQHHIVAISGLFIPNPIN